MEITRMQVIELLERFKNAEKYGQIVLKIEKGQIVLMEEIIKHKPNKEVF